MHEYFREGVRPMTQSMYKLCMRGVLAVAAVMVGTLSVVAQPTPNGAGGEWWSRAATQRSKYYNIKSDLAPADLKLMAEHMDATFEAYMSLFSRLPIRVNRPATLDVYLFDRQDDYMATLRSHFNNDGEGSWGKCISRGTSISLVGWRGNHSSEQLKTLMQHEGLHQVTSHFFSGLPRWADEGLAELFERGIMVDGQLVLGDFPAADKKRLLQAIDNQKSLPIDRLMALTPEQWLAAARAGQAHEMYQQSWSFVYFLAFAEQGKYEKGFLAFLVQLNQRVDWQKAFVTAFGTPDFKAIERKWLAYVREQPASDYRETVSRMKFLAGGLLELHKQGQRPVSIDELKQQLQEIKYESTLEIAGTKRRFQASDASLFEVPLADGVPTRKFALLPPRGSTAASAKQDMPSSLVAQGLGPQVFAVDWLRRGREITPTILCVPTAQWKGRLGKATAGGSSPK